MTLTIPKRTDGEIDIVFDPREGSSGTLYVANKGRPFNYGDLSSISVLAKSSKHPGQGIGNKGVGFKSVSSCPMRLSCKWNISGTSRMRT